MSQIVKYLGAEELNKHYEVYGHFYQLNLNEEQDYNCRSVLEIVSKAIIPDIESIQKSLPDAVVIMMNPGSSKPKVGDNGSVYTENSIVGLECDLVDTKPDNTQYQIMRLMAYFDWRHTRIINLSDLRSPKSSLFMETIKILESDVHSVFSNKRRAELERKMDRKPGAPVICAWGLNPTLIPFSRKVQDFMDGKPVVGVKKVSDSFLFRHARPHLKDAQQEWLDVIAKLTEVCINAVDSE